VACHGFGSIRFEDRGSVGVEIDPIDFAAGDRLCVQFAVKVVLLRGVGSFAYSIGSGVRLRRKPLRAVRSPARGRRRHRLFTRNNRHRPPRPKAASGAVSDLALEGPLGLATA